RAARLHRAQGPVPAPSMFVLTCKFAVPGHGAPRHRRAIPVRRWRIPGLFAAWAEFYTDAFPVFVRSINQLRPPCRRRMRFGMIILVRACSCVSVRRRRMLLSAHVSKGGTCGGPYLETLSAGSVRRVRVGWRDLAGSILS